MKFTPKKQTGGLVGRYLQANQYKLADPVKTFEFTPSFPVVKKPSIDMSNPLDNFVRSIVSRGLAKQMPQVPQLQMISGQSTAVTPNTQQAMQPQQAAIQPNEATNTQTSIATQKTKPAPEVKPTPTTKSAAKPSSAAKTAPTVQSKAKQTPAQGTKPAAKPAVAKPATKPASTSTTKTAPKVSPKPAVTKPAKTAPVAKPKAAPVKPSTNVQASQDPKKVTTLSGPTITPKAKPKPKATNTKPTSSMDPKKVTTLSGPTITAKRTAPKVSSSKVTKPPVQKPGMTLTNKQVLEYSNMPEHTWASLAQKISATDMKRIKNAKAVANGR